MRPFRILVMLCAGAAGCAIGVAWGVRELGLWARGSGVDTAELLRPTRRDFTWCRVRRMGWEMVFVDGRPAHGAIGEEPLPWLNGRRRSPSGREAAEMTRRDPPTWVAGEPSDVEDVFWHAGVGFPMRAVAWSGDTPRPLGTRSLLRSTAGIAHREIIAGRGRCRLLWWGIVVDVVVFGGALALVLESADYLVRRRRRAAGRCVVCNYEVGNRTAGVCPECGHERRCRGSTPPGSPGG
jgi:hypothetical protein